MFFQPANSSLTSPAQAGRDARVLGLDSGAEEYLAKPVDPAELSLRARNLLRLTAHGDDAVAAAPTDTQYRPQASTANARALPGHDAVTGMANAALFAATLRNALADAAKTASKVAVMSIDLDDFAQVNNTLGMDTGDELLRQFAALLLRCAGSRACISRVHEDKFALILPVVGDRPSPGEVAHAIGDALRRPFELTGNEVLTTASIGIAVYPEDAVDPEILVGHADGARCRSKKAGGNQTLFHSGQLV